MKYIVKSFLLIGLVLGASMNTFAQIYTSGNKIIHVQEAQLPKPGTLTVYNNMSVYGGSNATGSVWDVRSGIFIDYSFYQIFQTSLNIGLYQDINGDATVKESLTPLSDVSLTFKFGSFGFNSDYIYLGGLINFYYPIGDPFNHNTQLEVYRGLGPNFTLMGFFSYYADNLFPEESLGFHSNLGFTIHLDKDLRVNQTFNKNGNQYFNPQNTMEFRYGFGIKYPMTLIGFYGEIWGSAMITPPGVYVHGRESYTYLTTGLTFRPLDFVALDLSGDILVVGSKNESEYPTAVKDVNYAPWKLNVGMKFNILPFKTTYTIDPTRRYQISDQETQEIRNRIRIIEEDEQVTRDKVEVLKTKRKDVETNLKQLRDLLKNLDEQPASGN